MVVGFRLRGEAAYDIQISYPATQGSDLGLFPPNPHLGEQYLGFNVFLVRQCAGYSGGQVGALYRMVSDSV